VEISGRAVQKNQAGGAAGIISRQPRMEATGRVCGSQVIFLWPNIPKKNGRTGQRPALD